MASSSTCQGTADSFPPRGRNLVTVAFDSAAPAGREHGDASEHHLDGVHALVQPKAVREGVPLLRCVMIVPRDKNDAFLFFVGWRRGIIISSPSSCSNQQQARHHDAYGRAKHLGLPCAIHHTALNPNKQGTVVPRPAAIITAGLSSKPPLEHSVHSRERRGRYADATVRALRAARIGEPLQTRRVKPNALVPKSAGGALRPPRLHTNHATRRPHDPKNKQTLGHIICIYQSYTPSKDNSTHAYA